MFSHSTRRQASTVIPARCYKNTLTRPLLLIRLHCALLHICLTWRLTSAGSKHGGMGGFDAKLQGFAISPANIQICLRDDGTEWLLVS